MIGRIAQLDVRARHIVEGFLSGIHRSPYFGQSIEFLQHREYARGDDPRHIDWKVWAKQDRYYVKQFEEDTNLRCTLLVDVSGSMRYGSGSLNKYEYGCTIAASLAYLLVAAAGFGGLRVVRRGHPRDRAAAQQAESFAIDHPGARRECAAGKDRPVSHLAKNRSKNYPRRGMIVLISDLLTERDGLFRGLRLLKQRGHDVLVFHVMDDEELDFQFNGPTRFEGLETVDRLNCNPRALREGYLEALHAYLDEVRRGCARHVVDYALIRTSQPLDVALATYLSSRLGMHHRN